MGFQPFFLTGRYLLRGNEFFVAQVQRFRTFERLKGKQGNNMPEHRLIHACKQGKLWAEVIPVDTTARAATQPDEKSTMQEESFTIGMGGNPGESFFAEECNSLFAHKQNPRKYRSLVLALGSGGHLPDIAFGEYHGDEASYDNPIPGGEFHNNPVTGIGGNYNLLTPGDFTDIVHRPPLSLSLTADFPVGKKVSLETGFSYTYLFSRFRRNDQFVYRGTLQQHYVGVPVNLRYQTWQNSAWELYMLGGGTIEKGFSSVCQQKIEKNGIVYHTHMRSRIAGLQFSAQVGAGFSYRLHNDLYLFGEPRLVYYFRNNQPMSARTENPLIFGLHMGIRIQFK